MLPIVGCISREGESLNLWQFLAKVMSSTTGTSQVSAWYSKIPIAAPRADMLGITAPILVCST